MRIGDIAPDFEAETTEGWIRFHDWIGNSWAVLYDVPGLCSAEYSTGSC